MSVQNGQMQNIKYVVHGALLDKKKVTPILGTEPLARLKDCKDIIQFTNIPLYMIGDSGTGKSATMKYLLKWWSDARSAQLRDEKNDPTIDIPAFYFQLSPEDTKSSVILGHRIINGTLELVPGIMAIAAMHPYGAIIGVDEITHSTQAMLLLMNAFDGADSRITVGDTSLDASKIKLIYGSNASSHAGNIKVPPSFAGRVISKLFDYPQFDDELLIADDVARRNFFRKGGITIPSSIKTFITSYVREHRSSSWPLSARNIAHGFILAQLAPIIRSNVDITQGIVDEHFTRNSNIEASRLNLAKRILRKSEQEIKNTIKDSATLQKIPEIKEFIEFVSKIGVPRFKEIILQSINFHVDMDGFEFFDEAERQKIISDII